MNQQHEGSVAALVKKPRPAFQGLVFLHCYPNRGRVNRGMRGDQLVVVVDSASNPGFRPFSWFSPDSSVPRVVSRVNIIARPHGCDHVQMAGIISSPGAFFFCLLVLSRQKHHFQEVFNNMGQLSGKYLHWAVTGTLLPVSYSLLLDTNRCSRKLSSLSSPGLRPGSHEWAGWGRQSIRTTVQSSQCDYARNPSAKPTPHGTVLSFC